MLEFRDVSKRYGEVTALQPTSLQLAAGRTHVLLGTSGCGKSTLLKIAMGLIQPDTGSVCFEGEQVQAENLMRIRYRIGYVIQGGGLFPHLTAGQNVTLAAEYAQRPESERESRVNELAELTQLPSNALDRFPAQLSGGQQQRVALMRALMLDPDWLLLDEPLGALDPLIRHDLQVDLRQIFRTLQKSVILVTHDLQEAAYFADNIVLLRDGGVLQQGSLQELIQHPTDPFVTRFIQAQQNVEVQHVESQPGRE